MSHNSCCLIHRKVTYDSYKEKLEVVFDKQDVERGEHYFIACPDDTYDEQRPFALAIESCYCAAFYRKNH